MLAENKAAFDKLGISKWHDAGYLGERGLSITHERPTVTPNMNGQVEVLWSELSPPSDSSHAYWSTMIHLQVAPKRKIASVLFSYEHRTPITGILVDKVIPWMLEAKPDVGFASIDYVDKGLDEIYGPITKFCTLCNSAGNNGEIDYSDLIEDSAWLGIGATAYTNGQFIPEGYSSESIFVDFCGISPSYGPTLSGLPIMFNGTSCAAPFFAGMCALVNDFFIDKIDRPLSMPEMYDFMKAHCVDIYDPGKDIKTGWGIPILPDPATINPYEWVKEMKIKLTLGSNTMYVDGRPIHIDQAPYVDTSSGKNITVMPLRAPMEALGHKVIWDPKTPNDIIIEK